MQIYLKVVYTLFLGIMVALFIGFGISAFYQEPKAPEYPIILDKDPSIADTQEEKDARVKFEADQKQYNNDMKPYNRNVFIIATVASVILLGASFMFFKTFPDISNGILLGGVFTLVYAVIRGLMSEDSMIRFVVVTVGLAIALVLGYLRFGRHLEREK